MPQAKQKFFDPPIFQKCWRGVGEQPTFAEQIKLHDKLQQKSKREPQRIAIAFKNQKVVITEQSFRGNCDSQGKLGMCPSLAEPDSVGFSKNGVANSEPQANKSFLIQQFFKNAGGIQGE